MTELPGPEERWAVSEPCRQAFIVRYKGTKREDRVPFIMPIAPWCEVHDLPTAMCALNREVATERKRAEAAEEFIHSIAVSWATHAGLAREAERFLDNARAAKENGLP